MTTSKMKGGGDTAVDNLARITKVEAWTGASGSSSANLKWLVSDQLGTPRMIFDQSGSLATVSRHDYLPFGEELYTGTGGRTTSQGFGGDNVRQKFTSKERDVETGLDYFQARYYGSAQGRFTSADPLLASATIYDPQNWNRYTYASNSPLKYTDPTGLFDWSKQLGGTKSDNDLLAAANAIENSKDRKKALGKANEIIKRRNQFREALEIATVAAKSGKLTADQQAKATRAVSAYGSEGDGNKVIVTFGSTGSGVGAYTDGTASNDEILVTFNPNRKGKDLAITVAHEGSHVADNQDFNATQSGGTNANGRPTDISHYETERRAYEVSSSMAQVLGQYSYPRNVPTDQQIWSKGWRAADREDKRSKGIDQLIRNRNPDANPGWTFSQIKKSSP